MKFYAVVAYFFNESFFNVGELPIVSVYWRRKQILPRGILTRSRHPCWNFYELRDAAELFHLALDYTWPHWHTLPIGCWPYLAIHGIGKEMFLQDYWRKHSFNSCDIFHNRQAFHLPEKKGIWSTNRKGSTKNMQVSLARRTKNYCGLVSVLIAYHRKLFIRLRRW